MLSIALVSGEPVIHVLSATRPEQGFEAISKLIDRIPSDSRRQPSNSSVSAYISVPIQPAAAEQPQAFAEAACTIR